MSLTSSTDANLAEVFNALGHPARLEILEILRDGEACVCHIQAMLEQRQAYISQHLNVLRQAGLVISRKEGLRAYYRISDPGYFGMIDQAAAVLQSAGRLPPAIPADYTERKKACTCPQCTGEASCQTRDLIQVQYE